MIKINKLHYNFETSLTFVYITTLKHVLLLLFRKQVAFVKVLDSKMLPCETGHRLFGFFHPAVGQALKVVRSRRPQHIV